MKRWNQSAARCHGCTVVRLRELAYGPGVRGWGRPRSAVRFSKFFRSLGAACCVFIIAAMEATSCTKANTVVSPKLAEPFACRPTTRAHPDQYAGCMMSCCAQAGGTPYNGGSTHAARHAGVIILRALASNRIAGVRRHCGSTHPVQSGVWFMEHSITAGRARVQHP